MYGQMKMPKAPDRPLVPYMRYSRKMWSKVRAENPEAQLWDISKLIGQMWREVPDVEKSVFQQEYEMEKVEYEKSMKVYHNSAQYQAYMNHKNASSLKTPGKASRSRMDMGGVVIQPVDEDAENNELSARRFSAIRFDRNHRLVVDLLNSNMVNESRTVVAQQRIEMLKKQAESLIVHQKKLECELDKMEEVYNEKKRKMQTTSEDFTIKLAKVCDEKVQVEEKKYDEMVDEWTGKLAEAYEDYKVKEKEIEEKLAAEREKMAEATPVLYNLTVGADEKEEKKENEEEPSKEDKEDNGDTEGGAEKEKDEETKDAEEEEKEASE